MLATGIDFEARPPGKKVKRLSLLSGGERSLTAIAFLVAIFMARPSPFYVLDEVEAALDDTNLGRLLEIFTELRRELPADHHDPPEADDGDRRLAVRDQHARRRRLQRGQPAPAGARDRLSGHYRCPLGAPRRLPHWVRHGRSAHHHRHRRRGRRRRRGRPVVPRLRSRRRPPPPDHGTAAGGQARAPARCRRSGTATLEPPAAGGTITPPPDITAPVEPAAPPARPLEQPPPSAGRLARLRGRLARSQSAFGSVLLNLLSGSALDEQAWEEIEDTLITADMGVGPAQQLVEQLRTEVKVSGTRDPAEVRALLRADLLTELGPDLDRTLHTQPHGDRPAVVLVVGRQRHRQDHGRRPPGPRADRRRPDRAAGRGRHVPRRGRRPAPDLGRAGRRRDGPVGPRGRRPGQRGVHAPSTRASSAASTPSSSTRPAACTPRPA